MMKSDQSRQEPSRVLLAVLAHPDDETFGVGGTLAHYAHQGVEVHLVCATRGEVGEMDEQYMKGFNSIAERRMDELRCASEMLGIKKVHFLNYRDSGMPGSPDNEHPNALVAQSLDNVVGDVVHYIRLLKPQVVVTFDPIGGYRHPDHIAIHNATVRAFHEAGDPQKYPDDLPAFSPQRLYFHIMPHTLLKIMVKLMPIIGRNPRQFGTNKDIDLVSITEVSFPTHAVIDYREVADIREQASACHASQGGQQMNRGPFGWLRRILGARENFMLAYPEPANHKMERDLFENVNF